MMDDKIIWIGNRESEILYSNLFYKSITIYGSNKNNNISLNCNLYKTISEFFIKSINKELKDNSVKFFFYSNKTAEKVLKQAPDLREYIINKYNPGFLKLIENKTYAHLWASNIMPIIQFTELFGKECSYKNISKIFVSNNNKYVIQENYSSGGLGTYLLTEENETIIKKNLDECTCYMVSPYYENSFSVNVHIVISNNYVAVLSPSIQIIENINNRLLYKGADFIAYNKTPSAIKDKILKYAKSVGKLLSNMDYIGICGLDLLVHGQEVYFVEINPRFQASSILINKSLKNAHLPDLQTIVYDIYNNRCEKSILKEIEKIKVTYSTLSFYQNNDKSFNNFLLKKLIKAPQYIEELVVENIACDTVDEYMFRVIFNTNISSINFDKSIFVYQNLLNYCKYDIDLYKQNFNILKCALLTQGVIIGREVSDLYKNSQPIKKATFDAIDITVGNNNVINCPIATKFVELSPFSIRCINNEIGLFYLDKFIHKIKIALQEKLPVKYTKNNIDIHRIGFLTTDRVRIKHTSICEYKKNNVGCEFCHITCKSSDIIHLDDIYETIDYYESCVDFRHYLIGGPSNTYDNEIYYIKHIVSYIRSKSDKPIYIMSIPPVNCDAIYTYHKLGVNELAFNIEIYNRTIAKQIMPGKGQIPIEQYENALKLSSELFGIENTRSMLLIGMDSKESFLEGIEFLCKLGVTPMISPFRPMRGTMLSDFVPPSIDYVMDIYSASKEICKRYNNNLGPKCDFCKNNTLT